MSESIWELQEQLDEAKNLVIEKVAAYMVENLRDDPIRTWRTWCDIDEALETYCNAFNDYVACEV